jgi:hypothetical protein
LCLHHDCWTKDRIICSSLLRQPLSMITEQALDTEIVAGYGTRVVVY